MTVKLEIDESAYYADPFRLPSLSSSIAKVLLDKSPRHAFTQHPRLGGVGRDPSSAMQFGTVVHKLVLGKGRDFAVIHHDDYRKKAAQEERDAAIASGLIPIKVADYAEAESVAAEIRSRIADQGYSLAGESEVPIGWIEAVEKPLTLSPREGDLIRPEASEWSPLTSADLEIGGVPFVFVRSMLDHVIFAGDRALVLDIKTCESAHPLACAKHVATYSYDLQETIYRRGLSGLEGGRYDGKIEFVFVFAETSAPYSVTIGTLNGTFRERGEYRWRRAKRAWHECLKLAAPWPDYTRGVIEIQPPAWVMAEVAGLSSNGGDYGDRA